MQILFFFCFLKKKDISQMKISLLNETSSKLQFMK